MKRAVVETPVTETSVEAPKLSFAERLQLKINAAASIAVSQFLNENADMIAEKGCIPLDYYIRKQYEKAEELELDEDETKSFIQRKSSAFYQACEAVDGSQTYQGMPVMPALFPPKEKFPNGVPAIKIQGAYKRPQQA